MAMPHHIFQIELELGNEQIVTSDHRHSNYYNLKMLQEQKRHRETEHFKLRLRDCGTVSQMTLEMLK